jgi:hypothetical protein
MSIQRKSGSLGMHSGGQHEDDSPKREVEEGKATLLEWDRESKKDLLIAEVKI